ncbi:MAG: peptidoglycan DD-metalloendopeptidase family protein [Chitinophagales bacterium]
MKKKLIVTIIICQALLYGAERSFAQVEEPLHELTCVTEEGYQKYIAPLLSESYTKLIAEGKLKDKINVGANAKMGTGDLEWPLRMSQAYASQSGVYDYFQIWNYADLDHATGPREDWMCHLGVNARNYDNHNGVDIVPEPFRWKMMADESIEVIAAMDGEVLYIADGYFDRNCGGGAHTLGDPDDFNGGYYGNFVALLHSDNSITVYAHMKSGTVADLEPGDEVVTGQFLGKLGSSGNSSDPHLHFEVRTCEACSYIEPWFDAAGCNDDVVASWWDSQLPYDDPQICRLMTHSAFTSENTCTEYLVGTNENIFERNHFASNSTVVVGVYLRDWLDGDNLDIDIINQAGVIQASWNPVATIDYQKGVTYNANTTMTGDPDGTYKLRVIHDGKTYVKYFTIGCTSTYTLSGALTGGKGWIAGDNINSTNTISGVSTNQVFYEAENYVQLNPGFVATLNSGLNVRIADCTVGGLKEDEPLVIDEDQQMLQVYPNPNLGNFDIQYYSDEATDKYFIIRNLTGEIIFTSLDYPFANTVTEHVDLKSQPKGIYFVEFHSGNIIETAKVIVQ